MINKIEDRLKLIELEIDDHSSDLQLDADGYDTDLFLYHLFCYRSSLFGVPTGSLLAAQISVKNLIKMEPLYKGTKSSGKKAKLTAKSCYLGKVSVECILG